MNKFMNKFVTVGSLLLFVATLSNGQVGSVSKLQTRCGWYNNPTPSNHSLYDKDGEWLIGAQGGYQAEGDSMPIFKSRQWIITNGSSYGYGCACFLLKVDYETNYVKEIRRAYSKPLSTCRQDPSLKKWKRMFK
jgi:hypothetical protein